MINFKLNCNKMDNYDLRCGILQQLDISDLSTICLIDHMAQNICSQKYFWSEYFKSYGLPLPKETLTRPLDWINLFNKYQEVDRKTKVILTQLSGPIKIIGYENTYRSRRISN